MEREERHGFVHITMDGHEFCRMIKAVKNMTAKKDGKDAYRWIELRAGYGECVATACDGFGLAQIRSHCSGNGRVLIPPTVPIKETDVVVIDKTGNTMIHFMTEDGELVYTYGYTTPECEEFRWDLTVERGADRSNDRRIAVSPSQMIRALEAAEYSSAAVVTLCVPEDPHKQIAVVAGDVQAIALPVRLEDENELRGPGNWWWEV